MVAIHPPIKNQWSSCDIHYKRLLAEARKQAEEELKEIDRKLKEMIMHD